MNTAVKQCPTETPPVAPETQDKRRVQFVEQSWGKVLAVRVAGDIFWLRIYQHYLGDWTAAIVGSKVSPDLHKR